MAFGEPDSDCSHARFILAVTLKQEITDN